MTPDKITADEYRIAAKVADAEGDLYLSEVLQQRATNAATRDAFIDIVFDGPPAHESGRFVEVENPDGASINVGEWIDRGNGLWALRIQTTGGAA